MCLVAVPSLLVGLDGEKTPARRSGLGSKCRRDASVFVRPRNTIARTSSVSIASTSATPRPTATQTFAGENRIPYTSLPYNSASSGADLPEILALFSLPDSPHTLTARSVHVYTGRTKKRPVNTGLFTLHVSIWRRGRDSNPRADYSARRFRGAPVTTTSVPLRYLARAPGRAIHWIGVP